MGKIKLKFRPKKVETFKCMNEQCRFKWTGKPGPGNGSCAKCDSIYYEWVNFRDDWYEDENDNWKWKRR